MIRPRIALLLCLTLLLGACAGASSHRAVPEPTVQEAVVKGFGPNIRYLGDEAPADLARIIQRRIGQYQTAHADYFKAHGKYPAMNYLALSGGGDNGAFGAGLLHGWTNAGTRPEFTIVTGVSTGALIAPFAFLGRDYDPQLKESYTTMSSENIFLGSASTFLDGLTGGMALTDNTPLEKMIEKSVTPEMFQQIAEEHRKGRRLLIGTTNLEMQRSVIWDIGTLANSANPDAIKLFRKILLASSAIPGAFKPVFFDVTAAGKTYSEIHVDGGVTAQVFLYPLQTVADEKTLFEKAGIPRNLYIIHNAKIVPEYQTMTPRLMYLSQRSIETLIKNQGIGDLYKLYAGAQRDGINYNMIYIPQDFAETPKEMFDRDYMSKLFYFGEAMAKKEIPWQHTPPSYALVEQGIAPPTNIAPVR